MIGAMLAKIRKDRGVTKSELAKLIGVDTGHLTHIEKGERKPSIKTLKLMCKVLDIPYQPLLYTYDKDLKNSQRDHKSLEYLSYTKILAFDDINSFSNFIDCPTYNPTASFAIKISDDSMLKTFDLNTYAYVELNTLVEHNDIGLFKYEDKILLRKLWVKQNTFVLKADNPDYPDIKIKNFDKFFIIGKILR